jgi:hypothetical protein
MMRNLFFLLLLCLTISALTAQVDHTAEKQQDILDALEALQPQENQSSGNLLPAVFRLGDLDDDGMDDDWETANGLNPNDPKDAWYDKDDDHILNLFEFQLQSDPDNPSSPVTIDFNPQGDDLADLLDGSEGATVVIRIPEGVYPLNYSNFYEQSFRVMLQGGWNSDFSEYDPEEYPTILDGEGLDEVFYFATGNDIIPNATFAVVLDGVHIINGGGFSLFGSLTLVNDEGKNGSLSVYHCKIYDGVANGIAPVSRGAGGKTRVFIARTLIANHDVDAMYSQITDDAVADWRVFNCTFTNNVEEGVDAFTNGDASLLEARFQNVINWGNGSIAFDLGNNINCTVSDSDFDGFLVQSGATLSNVNTFDADPLFVNPVGFDFELQTGSPCINAGADIGLPFFGPAPDMGAFEFFEQGNAVEDPDPGFTGFNLMPNPVKSNSTVFLTFDSDLAGSVSNLYIYDQNRRKLYGRKLLSGRPSLAITAPSDSGVYFLVLMTDRQETVVRKLLVTK